MRGAFDSHSELKVPRVPAARLDPAPFDAGRTPARGPADASSRAPYHRAMLEQRIRANLAAFDRHAAADDPALRRAAVAVTVLDGERVLIAKRVARGLNAGQWALPGGKLDAGEDAVAGALRELREEAGLDVGADRVAGLLDDFVTDSGFAITPVVVLAPDGALPRRNPAELASLHEVPLSNLLADHVPRWATTADGQPLLQMPLRARISRSADERPPGTRQRTDDRSAAVEHRIVIHAPTGAILLQFREVALRGRELRIADLVQPEWTRR
jgi:8-oxo-dGTP pyrophosphatase MutT (NUDIX family)